MFIQNELSTLEIKALKAIVANKELMGVYAISMQALRTTADISTTLFPEVICSLLSKSFITISTHDSYKNIVNGGVKSTKKYYLDY